MTAHVPTDRAAQRERVVKAAVEWVYDPRCSYALAELQDAVRAFMDDDHAGEGGSPASDAANPGNQHAAVGSTELPRRPF